MTSNMMNERYKEACKNAGVTYFDFYSWRHWRASKGVKEGKSLPEIQAKLGHAHATMTDNYLHDLLGT